MDADKANQPTVRKTPVYVFGEGAMHVAAPVEDVWRLALDYPSWQNYSIVRHVSGPPGEEGEVVLLKKDEIGSASTPYFARTIKLDPGRRVVWKTFRDNVEYFGIVEFKVEEAQAGTQFLYKVMYEHVVPYDDQSEVDAFRRKQYEGVDALFSSILPKLKSLAEREARDRGQ